MFKRLTTPQKFIMTQEEKSDIMKHDHCLEIDELKLEIKKLKESFQVLSDRIIKLSNGEEIVKKIYYYSCSHITERHMGKNYDNYVRRGFLRAGPFDSYREAVEDATMNYSAVVPNLKIWSEDK